MKRLLGLAGIIGAIFLAPLVLIQSISAVVPFFLYGDSVPAIALLDSNFVLESILLDITVILCFLGGDGE